MKRTFITRLPNKAGAFLKATRIVAQSGANITRVSYNKAVDLHVLFLEVSGSQAQLDTIAVRLNDVGYILNEDNPGRTILLESTCRTCRAPCCPFWSSSTALILTSRT